MAEDVSTQVVAETVQIEAVTDVSQDTPVEVADAVIVEAPSAEAPAEKTLLGGDTKEKPAAEVPKEEIKSEDAPKEDTLVEDPDTQKEEGSQSDEPAPLPTYDAFVFPENVTMDEEKLGEFTKELAEFQLRTNADQAEMQAFGQNLVNRHVAEIQQTVERLNEYYVSAWEKQKSDWKEAFEKDPDIGGNRMDTTVGAALEFIRTHGGNEAQQEEFRNLMDTTGIGNHPALIRILANANMAMAEGKPMPATKPEPQVKSKVEKRYGNSQ